MPVTATSIIGAIETPGMTLAFCDETDLTPQPTSTMVADIHLHAALVLSSAKYAPVAQQLRNACAALGAPEIHATEIVNPGKSSPWRSIAPADRYEILELACGLIRDNADALWYAYMSKAQYAALRKEHPTLPADHRTAVKESFLGHLSETLKNATSPAILKDKDKSSDGATMKLLPDSDHIVGGGAVCADSHLVPGLQLADVAAFLIGRFIRRRDAIQNDETNALDALFMQTLDDLSGRMKSLIHEATKNA